MSRFKSMLSPVVSPIIAFATLAIAALFPSRSRADVTPPSVVAEAGTPGLPGRRVPSRRMRRLYGVSFAALLGVSATAFAAGASTPTGARKIAVGDQIPHTTPKTAAPATAVTPPTTAAPTTTTTAPPPPPPPTTAAPAPPPAPVSVSGACGGNLPPCCVMMRESGGNPTAVNTSSGASGKWQFMSGTWANYRGYPTAASAPEWIQDERAAQLWAGGAGAGHWGGGC